MVHGANCIAIVFMMAGCNACLITLHETLESQERKHGNLKKRGLFQLTNGNTAAYVMPYHSSNKQAL